MFLKAFKVSCNHGLVSALEFLQLSRVRRIREIQLAIVDLEDIEIGINIAHTVEHAAAFNGHLLVVQKRRERGQGTHLRNNHQNRACNRGLDWQSIGS